MAQFFDRIQPPHAAFIAAQHIFFTASAAATGRVNISPRGADAFRVVNDGTVAYLDETGSGNETAAHLRASGRLTIMFCGFAAVPMIMRLYGTGRSVPRGSAEYCELLQAAFDGREPPGARQIVVLDVQSVQTSCGYGVPLFDYREDRPTLRRWAESKGEDGMNAYRATRNAVSIDGFPAIGPIDGFPAIGPIDGFPAIGPIDGFPAIGPIDGFPASGQTNGSPAQSAAAE